MTMYGSQTILESSQAPPPNNCLRSVHCHYRSLYLIYYFPRACRTNIRHLYACRLSTFVRVPKGRCHLPPTAPPSIIPQVVCVKALKLARVLFGVVIRADKIHVCSHKTRTLCRRPAMMDDVKAPPLSVPTAGLFYV
jgi:hypothetical protein